MTRIASVTIKPGVAVTYMHNVIVQEDGCFRHAIFQHVRNEYVHAGNGAVRLQSMRYERIA